MPWGRCDDGFYDHPKVRAMSPTMRNAACGVFWRGISLCNRILSDGKLSQADVGAVDGTDAEVAELVRVRLWHRVGKGFRVHDFLDFNDSREVIEARRAARSAAGRKGGLVSAKVQAKRKQVLGQSSSKTQAPGVQPLIGRAGPGTGDVEGGAGGDADHLDAWYRLTASWPSPKVIPWLNQLAEAHGSADLVKALAVEWTADPDRATVLGRTRTRLEREAHEAKKAAEARDRREAEEERQRIEAMPEVDRTANLTRLREMMTDTGLLPRKGATA